MHARQRVLRDPGCAPGGRGRGRWRELPRAAYVAGLYNRLRTDIAGRTVENEDLVNVPNWLPLSFRVADGEWFDVRNVDLLEHH